MYYSLLLTKYSWIIFACGTSWLVNTSGSWRHYEFRHLKMNNFLLQGISWYVFVMEIYISEIPHKSAQEYLHKCISCKLCQSDTYFNDIVSVRHLFHHTLVVSFACCNSHSAIVSACFKDNSYWRHFRCSFKTALSHAERIPFHHLFSHNPSFQCFV